MSFNYEEFEAWCNSTEKEMEEINHRAHAFMNALDDGIIELTFKSYPDLEVYRDRFENDLKTDFHEHYTVRLMDTLDHLLYVKHEPLFDNPSMYKVEAREDYPDIEEQIIKRLKELPAILHTDYEYLREVVSDVRFEAAKREFMFKCHDKMKELIFEHYPEIMDLPPNSIHFINWSTHLDAYHYHEGFYFLTMEHRNDDMFDPDKVFLYPYLKHLP